MEPVSGAQTFTASGDAYDRFMGRYSRPLAERFADFAGVRAGRRALDVGCGPGAFTAELVARLGADSVAACDPSPSFVAACGERHPGVDVRPGTAEDLPFEPETFDVVAAQLVLHFVSDAARAGAQMARVACPGGVVAASVWARGGMGMLEVFWEAAESIDDDAPSEKLSYGDEGDLTAWLTGAGLDRVTETTVTVTSVYSGFEELWQSYLHGVGPPGAYCLSLDEERRATLREALYTGLGSPSGSFSLDGVARLGRGVAA
jgi:SAM-dependent methyltransferase